MYLAKSDEIGIMEPHIRTKTETHKNEIRKMASNILFEKRNKFDAHNRKWHEMMDVSAKWFDLLPKDNTAWYKAICVDLEKRRGNTQKRGW